ncbi:MAG: hypothetical protein AAF654_13070 [Myxococcota bacterium]
MTVFTRTLVLVGLVVAPAPALATEWSAAATELITDQERRFETGLKTFAHYCGVSPEWSIDWTSAGRRPLATVPRPVLPASV